MWELYTLLAVLFMGFNSFIVKKLIKKIKPEIIIVYQFLLASPLVFSYLLLNNWDYSFNPLLIFIGVGYFISLIFYYTSLIKGNLSKSGPIFSLGLIISSGLGFIILKENFNWKIAMGLFFGILSIYFLRGNKK
jgi:drug/metabolite transporter (DMT)-like permease